MHPNYDPRYVDCHGDSEHEVPLVIRLNEDLRPQFERKLEEYKERQSMRELEAVAKGTTYVGIHVQLAIAMVTNLLENGYTIPWREAADMMMNMSDSEDCIDVRAAVWQYGPVIAAYASDNLAGVYVHGSW